MSDLPKWALSVRQPWAHCLVMRWKDIENRSWRRPNPGLNFRGEFAIHASTGMTQREYRDCRDYCDELGFALPIPSLLLRGGIVGVGRVVDIVTTHDSAWFFGPKGLVIADARPIDFIPVGGQLGFFEWRKLLPFAKNGKPVEPAKWMLPTALTKPVPVEDKQGSLL